MVAPLMRDENAGVLVCNWLGVSARKPAIMGVFRKATLCHTSKRCPPLRWVKVKPTLGSGSLNFSFAAVLVEDSVSTSMRWGNGAVQSVGGISRTTALSPLIEAVTDYAIYMLDPTGVVTSWIRAQRFKGYAPPKSLAALLAVLRPGRSKTRDTGAGACDRRA